MVSTPPEDPSDFASAFDAALTSRAVGLTALQRRLVAAGRPISLAALSMWRSGRRRPEGAASLTVVATIETLLGLPARGLEQYIGPSHRRPPVRPVEARDFDELVGRQGSGFTKAANAALGIDDDLELVRTSVRLILELDEHGFPTRLSDQIVWRAQVDGARLGSLNMFFEEELTEADLPEMRGLSGCTVTGRFVDHESRMVAFAVALDQPLEAGEFAMTECEVLGVDEPVPDTSFEFVAERRMVEGAVQVRFVPGALPVDCVAWVLTDDVDEEAPARFVGTSVLQVRRNFGPGRFGFRWAWPGDT